MAKATFLIFVWGPAMLGFSLGWLVHHPGDWTGPVVIAPLSGIVTFVSFRWGLKKREKLAETPRLYLEAGMASGALMGVVIFAMLVLGILD